MTDYGYRKAKDYSDLGEMYENCCGPGALKLTEFLADKMEIKKEHKLLDVGTNRGYQTCFLAREYGPLVVGIDPSEEMIEEMTRNARKWMVEENILGIEVGVPETDFADASFDRVYSTTTLEMMRGMDGEEGYRECLEEIYRVLKPGGIFGLGEPMHRDVEIPEEILPHVTTGDMPAPWAECFATVNETGAALQGVGFEVIEAAEAPDARLWWKEYAKYDPEVGDDAEVIEKDRDRWLTFGYAIARK